MDGQTDGRTDKQMDGQTDGQTDGRTDGRKLYTQFMANAVYNDIVWGPGYSNAGVCYYLSQQLMIIAFRMRTLAGPHWSTVVGEDDDCDGEVQHIYDAG
jgi:hypothetical protein